MKQTFHWHSVFASEFLSKIKLAPNNTFQYILLMHCFRVVYHGICQLLAQRLVCIQIQVGYSKLHHEITLENTAPNTINATYDGKIGCNTK